INGAAMKIKIRGKDTDDREWPGIDLNFPAQYALIAPKPVLPEAITDDNNPSIGGVFLLREDAPAHRPGAQQRQHLAAHGLGIPLLRAPAVAKNDMEFEKSRYRFKDRVLGLPVEVVTGRNHVVLKFLLPSLVDFIDHRQL